MRRYTTAAFVLPFFLLSCGGSGSPASPSASTSRVTEVRVGATEDAHTVIEPGATKQLAAQAIMSDGSTQDVTNLASWQTSNPSVATVSSSGLVTAHVEGDVTISARFTATGSLAVLVRKGCVRCHA